MAGAAIAGIAAGVLGGIASGAVDTAKQAAGIEQQKNADITTQDNSLKNTKDLLKFQMRTLDEDGIPKSALFINSSAKPVYSGSGTYTRMRSNANTSSSGSTYAQQLGYTNYGLLNQKKHDKSVQVGPRHRTTETQTFRQYLGSSNRSRPQARTLANVANVRI